VFIRRLKKHNRYLREYQSLGTAGGLHHFKDEILRGQPKSFYVLNAGEFPLLPVKGERAPQTP
jgi:mannose-1-phosphate guanylyltransferase